jgi:glutamate--cysteine ligase
MRGADGGPWRLICGLPALWVGLLYDEEAQRQAAAIMHSMTAEEREYLRSEVPVHALQTPFRDGTVQDLALEVISIARGGLKRRGKQEEKFLNQLDEIAQSGQSQADHVLAMYNGEWNHSVDPYFSKEYSF